MDTFLTESKNQNPEVQLLANVRKEHQKLEAVVSAFGSKVENMIDKQRNEYVQAYGHHMRDVQKELHLLREKATAIANDRTRDEKIKKLDSDQKWYRNEAIRLDAETNILRKKLKQLTANISSIEQERDWLLSKLREAKTKYKELQTLRAGKTSRQGHDEGMSLLSNDSSFTLEIAGGGGHHAGHNMSQATSAAAGQKMQQWKSRLESDYGVSRDHAMMGALSHMMGGHGPQQGQGQGHEGGMSRSHSKAGASRNKASSMSKQAGKRTLGRLVAARAKKEALGDFINQCANSCGKGAFVRPGPGTAGSNGVNYSDGSYGHNTMNAPVETLVEECLQYISSTNGTCTDSADEEGGGGFDTFSSVNGNSFGGGSFTQNVDRRSKAQSGHFHQLVKDLATRPETYIAISDIMSGVHKTPAAAAIRPISPASGSGSPVGSPAGQFSRGQSMKDFGSTGNNSIQFTDVKSKSSIPTTEVPDFGYGAPKIKSRAEQAAEAANPHNLRMDRDVLAYLTMEGDRRMARKEMRESGSAGKMM